MRLTTLHVMVESRRSRTVHRSADGELMIVHRVKKIGGVDWAVNCEPVLVKEMDGRRELWRHSHDGSSGCLTLPLEALTALEIDYDVEVYP